MTHAPISLIMILGLSAIFFGYLAAWTQLQSKIHGAREFFWTLLASACYSLGYAIEISRTNLQDVLHAIRLEYVGLAFIPTLMLLFALRFIRKKPLGIFPTCLILTVPCITLAMVNSMPHHSFYYINPQVIQGEFFPVLVFERGIWYYIAYLYLFLSGFLSMLLLIVHALKSNIRIQKQVAVLAFGTSLPLLAAILRIFDLIPGEIDPTPFSLVFTSVIFALAFFRLGLFELVPAARELALDSIAEGFLVIDQHGKLQDYNKAIQQFPGADNLIAGETLPHQNELVIHLLPLIEHQSESVRFAVKDQNKQMHHYTAKAQPIFAERTKLNGLAILISDITESVNLMEELSIQANIDDLTGLFNRRHLLLLGNQILTRTFHQQTSLGIVLIDLDNFKEVNDQYGHIAGDEVLKKVAGCLRRGIRQGDVLGRYGGDEFALFMPNANLKTSIQVTERLHRQLSDLEINIKKQKTSIEASFGIHALQPDKHTKIESVLHVADQALYQAKAAGGNRWISSSSE